MISAFLSGNGDFVGKVLSCPRYLAACAAMTFLWVAPVAAQSVFPQTPPHQTAAPAADLETLRQSLDTARDAYRRAMADTAPPPGATPEELLARSHLQRELVTNLEQSLDMAQRLSDGQRRVDEQRTAAREWTGFATPPPYSVLLLDQLRKTQDDARFAAQSAAARITLLDQEAAKYEQELRAAEIERRQSEERLAAATTQEQRNRQSWLRDLAALEARAAAAGLEKTRRARKLTELQATETREVLALSERQVAVARRDSRLTQEELNAVLADIDRQRAALEKRQAAALAAGQRSQEALTQAQQALARFRAEQANPSDPETVKRREILERTLELRRMQADNDVLAVDLSKRMLDLRAWERTGWQYRGLMVNSRETDKLREGLDNLEQLLEQLRTWNAYLESELSRPSGRDTPAQDRLAGLSRDQAALAQQIDATQRARLDLLREAQQAVADLQRTLSVWREDFLARGADRSARSIFSDTLAMVWQGARAIWQFEILSVEDTLNIDGRTVVAARSITLGKALNALLFLGIGYVISRWLSHRAGQFAVQRLGAVPGHARTISRWMHMLLLGSLLLFALYMVNIPLTMFAFLGGALAIGLGFGTQVLLKNLVAGIMLLVERPLKVGDLIEVGSIVGTVTNIDIRSSTVRTGDGIEILVPNSVFIENNVTNWTYSNAKVRRSVKIGVDYSATPTKVRDLLLKVASQHGHVLTDPPPRVLFEDFGADALMFNLQYWIDYGRGTDAMQVASDLRFMIEGALGEAGIGIPYPQRVVHLRTLPPEIPQQPSSPIPNPDA